MICSFPSGLFRLSIYRPYRSTFDIAAIAHRGKLDLWCNIVCPRKAINFWVIVRRLLAEPIYSLYELFVIVWRPLEDKHFAGREFYEFKAVRYFSGIVMGYLNALCINRCSDRAKILRHPHSDWLIECFLDATQNTPNITANLFAKLEVIIGSFPRFKISFLAGRSTACTNTVPGVTFISISSLSLLGR